MSFAVILGSGAGAGVAIAVELITARTTVLANGAQSAPQARIAEIPGPSCYCGRNGCLERWVSGWSFARDYHQHASIDLATSELLGPVEIVDRMRQGDRLAKLVWGRYVDRLARGLSLVVNVLDPDILVIGGGMANINELYDDLPERLAEETFSPCFYTPIAQATHGDSSGVRGAACLENDHLNRRTITSDSSLPGTDH